MKISIIFMSLLLVGLHCQNYDAVFALSWFSGFCESINDACTDDKWALWDHQSFTIHGLWPSTSFPSVGAFNANLLSGNLLDDMNNYWPPQSQSGRYPYFLWDHEWQDHGQDYAGIMYKLHSNQYPGTPNQRNQNLQVRFFQDVINLYKTIKAQKIPKGTFTKAQLAAALGVNNDQYYTRCTNSGYLLQVRICINISGSGNSVTSCKQMSSNCPKTLTLSDWKISNQKRVTAISSTYRHMLNAYHEQFRAHQ